jgi:hypothetical protein
VLVRAAQDLESRLGGTETEARFVALLYLVKKFAFCDQTRARDLLPESNELALLSGSRFSHPTIERRRSYPLLSSRHPRPPLVLDDALDDTLADLVGVTVRSTHDAILFQAAINILRPATLTTPGRMLCSSYTGTTGSRRSTSTATSSGSEVRRGRALLRL